MWRTVLFAGALLAQWGYASGAGAQPAARYAYLGKAAEQLMTTRLKGQEASAAEFASAMEAACQSLKLLLDDDEFRSRVSSYKYSGGAAREVLAGFDQLAQFLVFEQKVLQDMGVSFAAANEIVAEMSGYTRAASALDWRPSLVLDRLAGVRDAACKMASEAADKMRADARWVLVIRVGRGVVGAAIVVTNLAAAVPTSAVSAASVSIGTTVLMNSL